MTDNRREVIKEIYRLLRGLTFVTEYSKDVLRAFEKSYNIAPEDLNKVEESVESVGPQERENTHFHTRLRNIVRPVQVDAAQPSQVDPAENTSLIGRLRSAMGVSLKDFSDHTLSSIDSIKRWEEMDKLPTRKYARTLVRDLIKENLTTEDVRDFDARIAAWKQEVGSRGTPFRKSTQDISTKSTQDNPSVVNFVREVREQLGVSNRELAELLNTPKGNISYWISVNRIPRDVSTLDRLGTLVRDLRPRSLATYFEERVQRTRDSNYRIPSNGESVTVEVSPEILKERLSSLVTYLHDDCNISYRQLAQSLGVSQNSVTRYGRGQSYPQNEEVQKRIPQLAQKYDPSDHAFWKAVVPA